MPQTDVVSDTQETGETKEWTLMFYFASDNPLAPSIISQLKSIKDAGFHPDANVIARFDPHGSVMPTHVFEVNLIRKLKAEGLSQVGPNAGDPFVRNLVTDKLWGEETASFRDDGTGKLKTESIREHIARSLREKPKRKSVNGNRNAVAEYGSDARARTLDDVGGDIDDEHDEEQGDHSDVIVEYKPPPLPRELAEERDPANSLASFLTFCGKHYRARHYILFVVGHGLVVGNDLFLFDENISGVTQTPQQAQKPDGQDKEDSNKEMSPPSQALLLKDLGSILRKFSDEIKARDGVLELVSFHSCSMSSLEVAYEICDAARYMLASQGPAFVGSWPYRQIVMRVFNDLNCLLKADDVEDLAALLVELKARTGPVYELLKARMDKGEDDFGDIWAGLDLHTAGQHPHKDLLWGLVRALNVILCDPQLCKGERFLGETLAEARRPLEKKRPKFAALSDGDVRRLNRRLFTAACPGVIAERPRVHVRKMLKSIFYYCLYNSLDYQLAGYSFDIALCDLSQVKQLAKPLRGLTEALLAGLESDDRTAEGLILLAHWDAQSFWQENYTDLYDFCLRLYARCREVSPALAEMKEVVKNIKRACFAMMKALSDKEVPGQPRKEGSDPDLDDVEVGSGSERVVRNSEFAGPTYQYAHGLSIYFPWAEPVASPLWSQQYHTYQLNEDMRQDGHSWRCFLKKYFDATMRRTRADEDSATQPEPHLGFDRELIEAIATEIFGESGQLAGPKAGGGDPMGPPKAGGNDPMGGDYATIKNYPTISRQRRTAATAGADGTDAADCEQPGKGADAEDAKPVMPLGEGIHGLAS